MGNCEYCDGDRDDFVKELPKANKGFNGYVWKYGMDAPHLVFTAKGHHKCVFNINYCPMCGKKLRERV